jgi:IMP dehydrogenase
MIEKEPRLGLTYDDVVLVPSKSAVLPSEVDVRTQLTRNIQINIPIISSAMDTVTESRLAIAMAREGGMGIIHRVLTPADQAAEVDRVKKFWTQSPSHRTKRSVTLTNSWRDTGFRESR